PPSTQLYPPPLHDALPIYHGEVPGELRGHPVQHHVRLRIAVQQQQGLTRSAAPQPDAAAVDGHLLEREAWKQHRGRSAATPLRRSEEHTSELQSLTNLVCR